MPQPMIGSWVVRVHGVRPYTIHGDVYYEVHVTGEGEEGVSVLRVPEHAMGGAAPVEGERLTVTFLMGQVTGVKR